MDNIKLPLVSIGVPVYGVESYIERCARSIFEQTYENLEIQFIDDCSPDNSINILNDLLDQYPTRKLQTRIIKHEKNRGLAAARNTVLDNLSGSLVMWVDSDDWLDTNAVELAVKAQLEGDYDVVTFDAKFHSNNGRSIIKHYPVINDSHELCVHCLISDYRVWGRLIRSNIYRKHDIRPLEGANLGEDYQQIPFILYFSKKIFTLNNVYYNYECSNVSSYTKSNQSLTKIKQLEQSRKIVEDFFKDKGQDFLEAIQTSNVMHTLERVVEWDNVTKDDIRLLNENRKCAVFVQRLIRPFFYLNNIQFTYFYCAIYNGIKKLLGFTK